MSSFEIDDALDACWNGYKDRDCEECPANPDLGVGGACCFGRQYDANEAECKPCPHRKDCAEACGVIDGEETAPVRPVVRTYKVPVAPSPPKTWPLPRQDSKIHQILTSADQSQRSDIGYSTKGRGDALDRFFKDTIWGAGEGFFKQAYEFFRTHRLR